MAANGANIGMMDPAYFVGRNEILRWLSEFLQLPIQKIEETASGAVACQLMDAMFPGCITMSKVDFSARNDYEYIKNYKLLQSAFDKMKIQKIIEVEKLCRGKYQDNFEFMQWMKALFDNNYSSTEPYDAASSHVSSAPPHSIQRERPPVLPAMAERRAAPPAASGIVRNAPKPAPGVVPPIRKTARDRDVSSQYAEELASLQDELAKVRADKEAMEGTVEGFENERDFYYGKLRQIEVLLQDNQVKETDDSLAGQVIRILYATDDDSSALAEAAAAAAAADGHEDPEEMEEEEEFRAAIEAVEE